MRGEPHCEPPTAVWDWPSWAFPGCQSLAILERLASYHPAFPFHAWLTLYHIQISGRPLALREHTFPSIIYVHMWKHWEDRPIVRSSRSRGEVPDVWVGTGPVLHSCHCQQWLWSCHRLDRHTVLPSSCNTGICDSRVPLNCLLLNTRYFSNTSSI